MENPNKLIACVCFKKDQLHKKHCISVENIFYNKNDYTCIEPKDIQDYDEKHKYYIFQKQCKFSKCKAKANCCSRYSGLIYSLGETNDEALLLAGQRSKRLIIPKEQGFGSSSDNFKENKKPCIVKKLKNIKATMKKENSNKVAAKYIEQQKSLNIIKENTFQKIPINSVTPFVGNESPVHLSPLQSVNSNNLDLKSQTISNSLETSSFNKFPVVNLTRLQSVNSNNLNSKENEFSTFSKNQNKSPSKQTLQTNNQKKISHSAGNISDVSRDSWGLPLKFSRKRIQEVSSSCSRKSRSRSRSIISHRSNRHVSPSSSHRYRSRSKSVDSSHSEQSLQSLAVTQNRSVEKSVGSQSSKYLNRSNLKLLDSHQSEEPQSHSVSRSDHSSSLSIDSDEKETSLSVSGSSRYSSRSSLMDSDENEPRLSLSGSRKDDPAMSMPVGADHGKTRLLPSGSYEVPSRSMSVNFDYSKTRLLAGVDHSKTHLLPSSSYEVPSRSMSVGFDYGKKRLVSSDPYKVPPISMSVGFDHGETNLLPTDFNKVPPMLDVDYDDAPLYSTSVHESRSEDSDDRETHQVPSGSRRNRSRIISSDDSNQSDQSLSRSNPSKDRSKLKADIRSSGKQKSSSSSSQIDHSKSKPPNSKNTKTQQSRDGDSTLNTHRRDQPVFHQMAIEHRHNIPDLNSSIEHHGERDNRVIPRRRINRRRQNLQPLNPPRIQDEEELELESEFFCTMKRYKKHLFNRYKRYGLLNFPAVEDDRELLSKYRKVVKGRRLTFIYLGWGNEVERDTWRLLMKQTYSIFLRDLSKLIFKEELKNMCLDEAMTDREMPPAYLMENFHALYYYFLTHSNKYKHLGEVVIVEYMKKSTLLMGLAIRDKNKKN